MCYVGYNGDEDMFYNYARVFAYWPVWTSSVTHVTTHFSCVADRYVDIACCHVNTKTLQPVTGGLRMCLGCR